jgi:hypothetical protein
MSRVLVVDTSVVVDLVTPDTRLAKAPGLGIPVATP